MKRHIVEFGVGEFFIGANGDFDALAAAYFPLVGDVLEKTGGDFIGHFDLITKFSERLTLRPTQRYHAAARRAISRRRAGGESISASFP